MGQEGSLFFFGCPCRLFMVRLGQPAEFECGSGRPIGKPNKCHSLRSSMRSGEIEQESTVADAIGGAERHECRKTTGPRMQSM